MSHILQNILWATLIGTIARDHPTPSTLIGGKRGAGPSSLHTTREGPTEYISECRLDVKSTWIPTWHHMDRVS